MSCYHPQTVYRSLSGRNQETGKWPITYSVKNGYVDLPLEIPCGRCIGCRLERSRQWAIRCVHESKLHENNCFITLTYGKRWDNVPTLIKDHYVRFMKRLREKYGPKIRFFHCGEYGEKFLRPHHHAILFNFDFPDKQFLMQKSGNNLYISESLRHLWPYGFHTIGNVSFESSAYVARYVMKKITGEKAESHYNGREPEYITMSRKPGIGKEFYEKFKTDFYTEDICVIRNGLTCRPPRYYDSIYDITNHEEMEIIKCKRKIKAKEMKESPERMLIKEKCKTLSLKKLTRSLENDN